MTDAAGIIGPICREYAVSPFDVLGKSRIKSIAEARAKAVRELSRSGASLKQIAQIFDLSIPGACRAVQRSEKRRYRND